MSFPILSFQQSMKKIFWPLVLILSGVFSQTSFSQQAISPDKGSALLDYCGILINFLDTPKSTLTAIESFKAGWCAGYTQGIADQLQLIKAVMDNNSSDKSTGPFGICIPYDVTNVQIARVFIKYLRDHPEQLHEYIGGLEIIMLHHSFPCESKK